MVIEKSGLDDDSKIDEDEVDIRSCRSSSQLFAPIYNARTVWRDPSSTEAVT
jgi:hypothetical protein